MNGAGRVYAWDVHEHRVTLIRATAHRLHLENVRPVVRDAAVLKEDLVGSMDAVLLDAPCSGLGVIRKRPEIRFKEESSLASLPAVQAAILNNLADYVRPGGTLMYSTCTILRAENEEVVEGFLANHSDYVREDFSAGGICSREGMYTFWPHREGTDGFFAAKLRRKTNLE